MKLTSYRVGDRASYGIVTGEGVIDAARHLGDRYPTLRAALAGNALPGLKKLAASGEINHKLADIAKGHADKVKVRLEPTRKEYERLFGKAPARIVEAMK